MNTYEHTIFQLVFYVFICNKFTPHFILLTWSVSCRNTTLKEVPLAVTQVPLSTAGMILIVHSRFTTAHLIHCFQMLSVISIDTTTYLHPFPP